MKPPPGWKGTKRFKLGLGEPWESDDVDGYGKVPSVTSQRDTHVLLGKRSFCNRRGEIVDNCSIVYSGVAKEQFPEFVSDDILLLEYSTVKHHQIIKSWTKCKPTITSHVYETTAMQCLREALHCRSVIISSVTQQISEVC